MPDVQDQDSYNKMTWPERVVHGVVLPLGLYFMRGISENLPTLEYDQERDELISTPEELMRLRCPVFCRWYRQNSLDKNGFVEVDKITAASTGRHLYYPLNDIPVPDISIPECQGWDKVKTGLRCVHIRPAQGCETAGYFRGIVELWGMPDSFEKVILPRFNIWGSMS